MNSRIIKTYLKMLVSVIMIYLVTLMLPDVTFPLYPTALDYVIHILWVCAVVGCIVFVWSLGASLGDKNKKDNRKLVQWLDKRIIDHTKEYNSIDHKEDFQRKISVGGQLRAFKEMRNYIESHE